MGGRKKRRPPWNRVDRAPMPWHESALTSDGSLLARRGCDRGSMERMDRSDAKRVTGTVPLGPPDWRAINWRKVARSVRRLQARIATAMGEGRRGKGHALRRAMVITSATVIMQPPASDKARGVVAVVVGVVAAAAASDRGVAQTAAGGSGQRSAPPPWCHRSGGCDSGARR